MRTVDLLVCLCIFVFVALLLAGLSWNEAIGWHFDSAYLLWIPEQSFVGWFPKG